MVLTDGAGNLLEVMTKGASPASVLTHQAAMARDATDRAKMVKDAEEKAKSSEVGDISDAKYDQMVAEMMRSGMDSDVVKKDKDFDAFRARLFRDENGVFLKKSDIEDLEGMDKTETSIRRQAERVLVQKGVDIPIDQYVQEQGLTPELAKSMVDEMISSERLTSAIGNMWDKGNALIDAAKAQMGISPTGMATDANVLAIAPAIAKALGHVGNLNESEVAAAAALVPGLANTAKEAASLWMLINGNIQANREMVLNRARFKHNTLPTFDGSNASEQGETPEAKRARLTQEAKALGLSDEQIAAGLAAEGL
jgi:hypothetical protein